MSKARALEVSDKVIALRNPMKESHGAFERRAARLHFELAGLDVGDAYDPDPPKPTTHKGRSA